MSQPISKLVGQLGDATPTEYGGYWVFVDETGVYAPEGELLEVDDETGRGTVWRFVLEDCTFIDGILSDNKYHPNKPAWFADKLDSIARYNDIPNLIERLASTDPLDRARGWRAIGDYCGFENLDSYPLELSRREVKQRYKQPQYVA